MKRTYQPSCIVRKRRHGYLARKRSSWILNSRRIKGRYVLSA